MKYDRASEMLKLLLANKQDGCDFEMFPILAKHYSKEDLWWSQMFISLVICIFLTNDLSVICMIMKNKAPDARYFLHMYVWSIIT